MFRPEEDIIQESTSVIQITLNATQLKLFNISKEKKFFEIIYMPINEQIFSKIYSTNLGRPNTSIKKLIGALLLKSMNGWTYDELIINLNINPLTRLALGYRYSDNSVLCRKTLFNFKNKLEKLYGLSGEILIEKLFNELTGKQISEYLIKTNIQRCDSVLIGTNIKKYSRMSLLVEILLRLHRQLIPEDKERYKQLFSRYLESESSDSYCYDLNELELPQSFELLTTVYEKLYADLSDHYQEVQDFQNFKRIYMEHFRRNKENGKLELCPSSELSTSCLQSPDDLEATYRQKREVKSRGFVLHVTETCHPDNPINLITDVCVASNNTDDSKILESRLPEMKAKTADLEELHTDGGYGNAQNDLLTEKLGINHVVTAIRGRKLGVEIVFEKKEDDRLYVKCEGGQCVMSETTTKRNKAKFSNEKCSECPLKANCPVYAKTNKGVYYFELKQVALQKRKNALRKLPPEKQKLRQNCEATMKEMGSGMNNKKLNVRGMFNVIFYAFTKAIIVNFGRIYRYINKYNLVFKKTTTSIVNICCDHIVYCKLQSFQNTYSECAA